MKNKLEVLVNSRLFNNFILILIVLNSLSLGIETFVISEKGTMVLETFNWVCIAVFIVEILIKLRVSGGKFFKSGWNIFDVIIIGVSILPEVSFLSSARVLRLLRIFKVFRATRVISKIGKLRKIVQALLCALPSIGWTMVLLAIIYYIFAVIGTNLYNVIAPEYFGDLWKSFYTLFQITMADDLGNISRPIMDVAPSAAMYFISFIVLATILVLNVIIGIVVDSIEEVKQQEEREEFGIEGKDIYEELENLEKQINLIKDMIIEKEKNAR